MTLAKHGTIKVYSPIGFRAGFDPCDYKYTKTLKTYAPILLRVT